MQIIGQISDQEALVQIIGKISDQEALVKNQEVLNLSESIEFIGKC